MKLFTTIILFFLHFAIYSQYVNPVFDGHKWEAPYTLPIPKDWTIERFRVPLSFAPQIAYKAIEDIRFAPGWPKANSEDYWSYAFLWWLDGSIKMDASTIETNLKAYYSGLVGINGSSIPREKLIPVVTSFKAAEKGIGELSTFSGTIQMTDYMSGKPITLQCKVHLKSCPGEAKTYVFYELSPQPSSHPIWQSLDRLWLDFKCRKD